MASGFLENIAPDSATVSDRIAERRNLMQMFRKHSFFKSLTAVVLAAAFLPASIVMAADSADPGDSARTTPGDISSVVQVDTANSSVTVKDSGGTTIDPDPDGNYADVADDATIKIHYEFSLPNDNGKDSSDSGYQEYSYLPGDTYTADLPGGLVYDTSAMPTDGFPVEDGFGEQMGTLKLSTDGSTGITSVTVTFGDYLTTHPSDLAGWFEINGSFSEESKSSGDPITIDFTSPAIIITPQKEAAPTLGISKSGSYDPDSNEITWTVKVTPSSGSFTNVSVEDIYDADQTYVADSFKRNGTSVSDSSLTLDAGSRTLTYTFPSAVSSQQTLTYKTKPTDGAFSAEKDTATDFGNTANLTATLKDADDTTATADATVPVTPDWINKSAGTYNGTAKTIQWTVAAGIDGQTISGVKIVDTLPAGLELDTGSEVKWVDPDGVSHTLTQAADPSSPTVGEFGYDSGKLTVNLGGLGRARDADLYDDGQRGRGAGRQRNDFV